MGHLSLFLIGLMIDRVIDQAEPRVYQKALHFCKHEDCPIIHPQSANIAGRSRSEWQVRGSVLSLSRAVYPCQDACRIIFLHNMLYATCVSEDIDFLRCYIAFLSLNVVNKQQSEIINFNVFPTNVQPPQNPSMKQVLIILIPVTSPCALKASR